MKKLSEIIGLILGYIFTILGALLIFCGLMGGLLWGCKQFINIISELWQML